MIVIDKKGNERVCEAVDGRELIASGEYSLPKAEKPAKAPKAPKAEKLEE